MRTKLTNKKIFTGIGICIAVIFVWSLILVLSVANYTPADIQALSVSTEPTVMEPHGTETVWPTADPLLPEIYITETDIDNPAAPPKPELTPQQILEQKQQQVLDSYQHLGIVITDGYLNLREAPSLSAAILGKLQKYSACEILEELDDGWLSVSSGGLQGYLRSEYIARGTEAETIARQHMGDYAIITADALNIRQTPAIDGELAGQALSQERYPIKSQTEEWIELPPGYVSANHVRICYALNEAHRLSPREQVINQYDNMAFSNVSNYLNIRATPDGDGEIVGKMPGRSAGEILEATNDWYKIRSGSVTGYVSSEYILTGAQAKIAAVEAAELMAVVRTDALNVRTAPDTESSIWTQVTNQEQFRVATRLNGWIEIEMDTVTGYVATEHVDVKYAVAEAIPFTVIREQNDIPVVASGNSGIATASAKTTSSSGSTTGHLTASGSGGAGAGFAAAPASSIRRQIAEYAQQFLGNPFVWGGTSLTNGADCSGFTMSVYSHFGIALPHHSGSQAQEGRAITSAEMRPGDLLFYANNSGTINHVTLYIGNGQVVHASNAKTGIKLSPWNYRTPAKIVNVLGD